MLPCCHTGGGAALRRGSYTGKAGGFKWGSKGGLCYTAGPCSLLHRWPLLSAEQVRGGRGEMGGRDGKGITSGGGGGVGLGWPDNVNPGGLG